jgi:hypothetical protein
MQKRGVLCRAGITFVERPLQGSCRGVSPGPPCGAQRASDDLCRPGTGRESSGERRNRDDVVVFRLPRRDRGESRHDYGGRLPTRGFFPCARPRDPLSGPTRFLVAFARNPTAVRGRVRQSRASVSPAAAKGRRGRLAETTLTTLTTSVPSSRTSGCGSDLPRGCRQGLPTLPNSIGRHRCAFGQPGLRRGPRMSDRAMSGYQRQTPLRQSVCLNEGSCLARSWSPAAHWAAPRQPSSEREAVSVNLERRCSG